MTNQATTEAATEALFSVGVFFEGGGFYVVEPWRNLADSRSAKARCESAAPAGATFEIVDGDFQVIC